MSFVTTMVHNQNDYWELNHKVGFDPVKRLITVYPSSTTLDVKVNLYSDMKEWMGLLQRDNRKYKPPIRVIGGDNTVAGQKAGDIYFMQYGWRVVYDPTKVSVTGVLFSDDYDTPWLYSETLKPIYPAQVASLVTGVDIESVTAPSAETVADAVRTELTTELANMDETVSSRASQTSVDAVQTTVNSVETKVDTIDLNLNTMSLVIDDIQKYGRNNSKIDVATKQLIIYDDDGISELIRYDLKDRDGIASVIEVFERIAV